MIKSAFTLATIVFFSFAVDTMAGLDTHTVDAAALYKKHCSACHPNAVKLRSAEDIAKAITDPPSSMPNFEDRISKNDVEKVVDYIRYGEKKVPEKSRY